MNTSISQKIFSMFLLIAFVFALTSRSQAQVCATFIKTFTDWVKAKPGQQDGSHAVGVKMAGVTIKDKNPDSYPWGFIYCAEGRLGLSGNDLIGRLTVVFSDRKGTDGKRFTPGKADLMDVTVFADGRVKIVLLSWGNATFFLADVKCSADGFITGILREGSSRPSQITLGLRKETMHPATDGFRDWPN
jgi:hypothetical protein